MKKILCMMLSLLMILSTASFAGAANVSDAESFVLPPDIDPLGVVYHNANISSDAVFETQAFACVSGNGNSLRFWFNNKGSSACTVQLFKKTILGLAYTRAPFTVDAGDNKYDVYSNPGSSTFVLRVTATQDGATVKGELKANQLDLTSS